jgi:hypothetical protein
MPDRAGVARAAERAVVGGGYPYEITAMRRRSDDGGWLVDFTDVSEPSAAPVFRVVIDDGATEDQATEAMLATIRAHQVPDSDIRSSKP